jgi:ketosteroid isomerase-like protein
MKQLVLAAVLAGEVCLLGACSGAKPVTEAEAAMIADETQTTWASRNVPAIESRYAKTVIGFDPADPKISTTWENWDRLQKELVSQQFDVISVPDRRIQVLDGDTFVVTGTGTLKQAADPRKVSDFRFTDVYQRQDTGRFVIVNEHVSLTPKPR